MAAIRVRVPRRLAVFCAALMVAGGLQAVGWSSPAAAAPAATACVPEQATEAAAQRMVQACRGPVEILSERTEFSQVFANADGSRSLEQSVEPQRVRRGRSWVPVDTTLKRTSAGVAPAATVLPMTFSGGGDTLVGRLVDGDREVAMRWPSKLPKPQLKAGTAVYPDVLPDVDLRVTATATGFSEVLVVHTREAAANPKLASLTFGLSAKGVRISQGAAGGLSARDADGAEVFSAPAPLMWDSSEPAESQASGVEPPRDESPSRNDTSGERKRKAVMPIKLGQGSVTLTPDKAMLSDPRTEFPVYIDPAVTGSMSGGAWTSVWSKYPTKSFWKNTTALTDGEITGSAGVGRTEDCVGCADHIVRSFFRMDTSKVKGDVIAAEFRLEQRWSWTCSPKSNAKVWRTGAISSATTWKKQPAFSSKTAQVLGNRKYGAIHGCKGVGTLEFDVTNMVSDADSTVTLGMKAIDESTKNQWKRYKPSTARLWVNFNQKPNALKNQKTDAQACVTGAGRPYVRKTTGVKLTGTQSDPDSAQTLTTHFYWWPTTVAPNTNNSVSQSTGNGGTATGSLPALTDGATYAWRAKSVDNVPVKYQMEAWSEKTCEFTVDATPPPAPGGLSSTDYSSTTPSGGVGYPGTFTVAAPVLTGVPADEALKRKKDIASYAWTLDGGVKVSAGTVPVNANDFTGSITLTPLSDGIKTLRVWSKDRAGNVSGQVTYTFTVLHGSGPAAGWDFDDAENTTTTTDVAEHGNTATLTGATRVAGRGNDGSALSLNGTSSRYATTSGPVTYPNASGAAVAVRTDASFTVTARVKLTSTATGAGQNIAIAANGSRTSAYTLGNAQVDGKWRFTMANTDADNAAVYSAVANVAATAGKWTHLAGVYDASTKKLTLYVNGVAQTTAATLPTGFNATGPVTVGKSKWNGVDGGFLNGAVDDVFVYSTVAKTQAIIDGAKPLQPAVSFPNGTDVSIGGALKATFDAEGDTNVTKFRYSIDGDGLGSIVNAAEAGGTATVDINVGTTKGERQLHFAAEDALRVGPKDQRTFQVMALASLSGPVVDEDGLPLAGATVTLQPGNHSTTSDEFGIYDFPELPVNTYTVRATHGGRCGLAGSQPFLVGKYGLELELVVRRTGDSAGHRCTERTAVFVTGTTVLSLTGDDVATRVALPFAFPFYGSAYNDVCVDTNGLLTFADTCVSHPYTGGGQLGAVAEPNGVIAAFWDDLVVDSSASVRSTISGSGATQQVLIEWNNVHRKGNTSQRLSFSAVLGIDGTVTTNYAGLDTAAEQGANALVGIESPTGEDGFAYSAQEAALVNGRAIVFTDPNADPLEVHNLIGKLTNAAGAAVAGAVVTLDPSGLSATTAADGNYAFYGLTADSYTVISKQGGRCGAKAEAVVDLAADTVKDLRFGPHYGLLGYTCTVGATGYVAATTVTGMTGDDDMVSVEMPFPMPFYGVSTTNVSVYTDGWIRVGGGYLDVFEDNLTIDSAASVRTAALGTAPNRSFVIEWRNAKFTETTDRVTFEVVLHENGRIAYHYGAMPTDLHKGSSAKVGMEDMSLELLDLYSLDEPALTANSSITYTPAAPGLIAGVLTESVTTEPLAGSTITLKPGGQTTTTGADGTYQFANIPPGEYEIVAAPLGDRCLGQYATAKIRKANGDAKADLSLEFDADTHYNCTNTTQGFIAADTVHDWSGDDQAWQLTTPFPIKLYGESTTRPWISSNGFLTFGPEGTTASGDTSPIPSDGTFGTPSAAIYPFWDDWVVDDSAAIATKISGTAPNRQWIVEWRNVRRYSNDSVRVSFEIILGEDGSITFGYDGIDDHEIERGSQATVGIENPGGKVAFQYLHRHEALHNGLGVRFAPKAPETNYLNGTVTCAGQPVDSATVTVAGQSTTTWSDGTYFLGDVPAKTQTALLTIASGECAGTTTETVLVGADPPQIDFGLQAAPQGTGYALTETEITYTPVAANEDLTSGHDSWETVELPFPVRVYGQDYASVSVGTEGTLEFGTANLYPFRGDWETDDESSIRAEVRGTAPNRRYVVEWRDVRHHDDPGTRVTFQAILDEGGGYSYVYPGTDATFAGSGGVATIGLETHDETAGLIYADRLTVLRPGVALRIEPTPTA